jgi:hypothetical protein
MNWVSSAKLIFCPGTTEIETINLSSDWTFSALIFAFGQFILASTSWVCNFGHDVGWTSFGTVCGTNKTNSDGFINVPSAQGLPSPT